MKSPSLAPLYARAVLTAPLHRGSALPAAECTVPGQPVDRARLTAFQQLCGYRVSDVLPPTYLHVLAFPASMALMTRRDFPFPVVGLVHIANAITVRRTVSAAEPVSWSARLAELRPHPAGRAFDVVVDASVDGEPVWSSRSTYLRREAARGPRSRPQSSEAPPPPNLLLRAPADIGRRYAAVSGDRNPIHLSEVSARLFGMRTTIAHGMWLHARVLATLQHRLPEAFRVDVRFLTPVFLPATLALSTQPVQDGWDLAVRDDNSGRPHLRGSVRAPFEGPEPTAGEN